MTDDVSRETKPPAEASTAPPAPESARGVFGSQLPLAERYADLLAGGGVVRGLIGPREVARLWDRHLLNCGVLAEAIPQRATVCDLGSGAGLPGVVLAIARPDLSVTLAEPLLRRSTFLEEVVAELGLGGCVVRRARAEELHGEATYDVVTARALAPLGRLVGWAMPLVADSGALLAMKGARAEEEIAAAAKALRRARCAEPEIHSLGRGVVSPETTVVRVARRSTRRVG